MLEWSTDITKAPRTEIGLIGNKKNIHEVGQFIETAKDPFHYLLNAKDLEGYCFFAQGISSNPLTLRPYSFLLFFKKSK